MKFCKDCMHYSPAIAQLAILPAICHGLREPVVNLVTGERSSCAGECKDVRADGAKCGTSAVWFKAKP